MVGRGKEGERGRGRDGREREGGKERTGCHCIALI